MRAKSFQFAFLLAILTPALAGAADSQEQLLLDKDHVAPIAALKEAIALLSPEAAKSAVTPQELDLFEAISHGRAKKINPYDAILTIAGVTTEKDHLKYTAKLDKIVSDAREAVADADNPDLKASKLNHFLHDNPLHGGFVDNQNDFLKLLDTGTYNCVSSAILFNIVGRKLGIKTRAVMVPGHVFLHDDEACIETTSGWNYEAASHTLLFKKTWTPKNDFLKRVFADTPKHECGNLGLFGEIYYNNSNLTPRDKHEQSVILALKAVCLEPKHPMYTYWLKVDLESWFSDTLQHKNFARAQEIADIYGKLFGNDSNKLFQQVAAARKGRAIAKS